MESAQGEGRLSAAVGDALLVSRSREIEDVSYRAFLTAQAAPRLHWATPDGLEIVGAGAAAELTADGPDRFETLRADADALFSRIDHDGPPATRPRAFGGLSFEPDHDPAAPWSGFPGARFVLPRIQLTRAEDATWLTVNAVGETHDTVSATLDDAAASLRELPMMRPTGGPAGVTKTRYVTDREAWTAQVERATDRIRDGDLRKVVLATALEVELATDIDVPDVLGRLRRTYPECFRFLVQPTETAGFFGPPPERLVDLRGRHVETEALAGSVPRGDTPETDADLADELRESDKIVHEQQLVVDAIRDQLEPLGDVAVGERGVRKLTNIQHLETPIEADLDADEHVLTIVEALHPTPAVGGLPPAAARDVIRETETFDRGWYAAPVGWFDATGDGEFAVAIRSAVAGGRHATLFAGNGIVADSDPAEEWAELRPKFRPVLDELTDGNRTREA